MAARPAPLAAYMVSIMSVTSARVASSMQRSSRVGCRRSGSGYLRMDWIAIRFRSFPLNALRAPRQRLNSVDNSKFYITLAEGQAGIRRPHVDDYSLCRIGDSDSPRALPGDRVPRL